MSSNDRKTIVFLGHVDHGKSTLIGRLLFDKNLIDKQKIERVSETSKINSRKFEFAYLLDALIEEQEKNITIDIARCYAKIDGKEYLFLDAPGHLEFLKNMLNGTTRADIAVLVLDVNEGFRLSTYCHFQILSFLNFKNIIICINKMDVVNYDQNKFLEIINQCESLASSLNLKISNYIPISAYEGENLNGKSDRLAWYHGKSFLSLIDNFELKNERHTSEFRMYVQDVYKGIDNSSVVGRVRSGEVCEGEKITIWPDGINLKILKLENSQGRNTAVRGDSISMVFDGKFEVKRGNLISKEDSPLPIISDFLISKLIWLAQTDLIVGQECQIQIGTKEVSANLVNIKEIVDLRNQDVTDESRLKEFQIAKCEFKLSDNIAFYSCGAFLDINENFVVKLDSQIKGAGLIVS